MSQINLSVSASLKKPGLLKPPIPVRPKHLVVQNSKSLPKPPENILTGNVTSFIKDLNIDSQNKKSNQCSMGINQIDQSQGQNSETPNSDEEDIDGYLEPVALSLQNILTSKKLTERFEPQNNINHPEENRNIRPFQKPDQTMKIREKDKLEGEDSSHFRPHSHRPLPLIPVKKEAQITAMPWYKNVDRKKGEELLKDGIDGYFLVRPSSKEDTFLTLTLWFHNRLYNIPIRKRRDGKYALGTPKANEQCFKSIEEMILNYQSEKLLLYSNGAKAGRTLLTNYPP